MNSINSTTSSCSLNIPSIFPLDVSFTPLTINSTTVSFFTTRNINTDISLVYTLDSGNTYNSIVVNNQAFNISGFNLKQTYNLRLRTYNNQKYGLFSKVFTFTPYTNSSTPVITSVVCGYNSITFTFTLADNGGKALNYYIVRYFQIQNNDNGLDYTDLNTTFIQQNNISVQQNGTSYTTTISPVDNLADIYNYLNGNVSNFIYKLYISNNNGINAKSAQASLTIFPYLEPLTPTISLNGTGYGSVTINVPSFLNRGRTVTKYRFIFDTSNNFTSTSRQYYADFSGYQSTYTITTSTGGINGGEAGYNLLTDGTVYYIKFTSTNDDIHYATYSSSIMFTPNNIAQPAPTSLSANPGNASVDINFTQTTNASSVSLPITNYYYSISGGSFINANLTFTSSSFRITGLTNGTEYSIRLQSYNGLYSVASSAVTFTPYTTPSAPIINSVTRGYKSGTITFSLGTNGNGGKTITNYEYEYRINAYAVRTASFTTATVVSSNYSNVINLENEYVYGYTYDYFKLRISNDNTLNWSDYSNIYGSISPYTNPDKPNIISVSARYKSATVNFSLGGNGGKTITNYYYLIYNVTTNTVGTSTEFTVSQNVDGTYYYTVDLDPGNVYTYYIQIRVSNDNGTNYSDYSTSSENVVPYTFPDAPTITYITPGNTSCTVNFTQGSTNGSINYLFTAVYTTDSTFSTGLQHSNQTTTPFNLTSLTNGYTYYIKLIPENTDYIKYGPESNIIDFTPYGIPDAPIINSYSAGYESANVTFSLPTNTGGKAITNVYYYYYISDQNQGVVEIANYSQYLVSNNNYTYTISNLTPNVVFHFLLTCSNNGSNRSANSSYPYLTPYTKPDTPTISKNSVGYGSVTINLPFFSNGGKEISTSGYTFIFNTTNDFSSTALKYYKYYSTYQSTYTISTSDTGDNGGYAGYNLINATTYYFVFTSTNDNGTHYATSSASISATPSSTPNAPQINSITPGDTTATIIFSGSSDNGGYPVDYYTVRTSTSPTGPYTYPQFGYVITVPGTYTFTQISDGGNPSIVSNLVNGTLYYCDIVPHNAIGYGTTSTPPQTFRPYYTQTNTAQPAATGLSANPGNTSVVISFTQTINSSSVSQAISSYYYSNYGNTYTNTNVSFTSSSCTITGLTNGQLYSMTLQSYNGLYSAASSAVTFTPYTVPSTPSISLNSIGYRKVIINVPSFYNGGKAITNYIFIYNTTGNFSSTALKYYKYFSTYQSSYEISTSDTGDNGGSAGYTLINGQQYYFIFTSTNNSGISYAASSTSIPASPGSVPNAPTITSAVGGKLNVTIYYTASSDTGGYGIDYYKPRISTSLNGDGTLNSPIDTDNTLIGYYSSYYTVSKYNINIDFIAGNTYYCDFVPHNQIGVGPPSNVKSFIPYDTPTITSYSTYDVTYISYNSVRMFFAVNPRGGTISKFELILNTTTTGALTTIDITNSKVTISSNNYYYTYTGMQVGYNYKFKIIVYNGGLSADTGFSNKYNN